MVQNPLNRIHRSKNYHKKNHLTDQLNTICFWQFCSIFACKINLSGILDLKTVVTVIMMKLLKADKTGICKFPATRGLLGTTRISAALFNRFVPQILSAAVMGYCVTPLRTE